MAKLPDGWKIVQSRVGPGPILTLTVEVDRTGLANSTGIIDTTATEWAAATWRREAAP